MTGDVAAAYAFPDLTAAAAWFRAWLWDAALPLWASSGVDLTSGAFEDALDLSGNRLPAPRRARVQARQVFVFATAARISGDEALAKIARGGFLAFEARHRRPDGTFANLVSEGGRILDDTASTYEQAFALLALSALALLEPATDREADALRLLEALAPRRRPGGGFAEVGARPFQANANMHLLEAAMAWESSGRDPAWAAVSDEIANLAIGRFIDSRTGALPELFDADWRALQGEAGLIEPGHLFEWAWLLKRWGDRRGLSQIETIARRLFECGLRGVDRRRGVAVGALWVDLTVRDGSARLWPQAEYLKAALALGKDADALVAANGLAHYLRTPVAGWWRDRMTDGGDFVAQPAPASSLYHLVVAALELMKRQGHR